MIPSISGFLDRDFVVKEQPTYTYCMDLTRNSVSGYTDKQEAMEQAIYKILLTERYQYIMYSWNYGIETLDLYGEPMTYVCPELERRITEALTYDERILEVHNFQFDFPQKHAVHVTFIVHTIFGDIPAEKEVNF